MDSFSLAAPPTGPGVYMLKRLSTGEIYIGQAKNMRQRWAEWKLVAQSGIGFKSPRMKEAMTSPEDWVFIVLEELPGADRDALLAREAKFLRTAALQCGGKLLNTLLPTERRSVQAQQFCLTYKAQPISVRAAADILQCSPSSLRDRCTKLKRRGITTIQLETLLELTAKWRMSGVPWAGVVKVPPIELIAKSH